ncbi:MAG: hypothetical protein V3U27_09255 [Candidatus Tectomicrobia bacterium]
MLEIMGRSAASDFQTYHRVLHRAVWSPLTASRLLLRLLVAVFIPGGSSSAAWMIPSSPNSTCPGTARAPPAQRRPPPNPGGGIG